ncbi:MAG TPA: hypothetical protein PLL23_09020 [Chitinophagaceae bacterium]|nr:hypothetical protein [Chitinophagaceae bacterium]
MFNFMFLKKEKHLLKMNRLLIFIFTIITLNSSAQSKSDLYIKVVTLFKDSLHFDTNNFEQLTNNNIRLKDAPLKTPAIIINEGFIEPYRLNYATVKDVKSILILQRPEASAILGIDGKFGAIIITGKKRLIRKLFPD